VRLEEKIQHAQLRIKELELLVTKWKEQEKSKLKSHE